MGFEETETIGPDGKPHIISEKTFNPSGPQPKLTKAQKAQQKAMQKEMQVLFPVHDRCCSCFCCCCYYTRRPFAAGHWAAGAASAAAVQQGGVRRGARGRLKTGCVELRASRGCFVPSVAVRCRARVIVLFFGALLFPCHHKRALCVALLFSSPPSPLPTCLP